MADGCREKRVTFILVFHLRHVYGEESVTPVSWIRMKMQEELDCTFLGHGVPSVGTFEESLVGHQKRDSKLD